MSQGDSQPLSSTPPTPASTTKTVVVPFTFLGCSAPPSSASASLLSGKAAASALTVLCPRSCVALCFLRLSFPAQLRRLVVRPGQCAFLAVHSAPSLAALTRACERAKQQRELSGAAAASLLSPFVHLVASHQLCPLEGWGAGEVSARVRSFTLPPPSSAVFSAASTATAVGLCLEMRGAEDHWRPEAQLGLQWLELWGVATDAAEDGEEGTRVDGEGSGGRRR